MKKLVSLILTSILLASICLASVSVCAATKPRNLLPQVITWNTRYMSGGTVQTYVEDGYTVYKSNGITERWCSPFFDMRDYLIAALGNADRVKVTLAFEIKVDFALGFGGGIYTSEACLLFRSDNTSNLSEQNWNSVYNNSFTSSKPVFYREAQHILCFPDTNKIKLTDREWVKYSIDLDLTREQIMHSMTPTWLVGIDKIGGVEPQPADFYTRFEYLMFRNVGLYYTDEYKAANATPTPVPTAKPTAAPTAAPTAKPTAAPTAVPTATPTLEPTATAAPTESATPTPNNTLAPAPTDAGDAGNGAESQIANAIIIAAVAIVVAGTVIAVTALVLKTKSKAKNEKQSDDIFE